MWSKLLDDQPFVFWMEDYSWKWHGSAAAWRDSSPGAECSAYRRRLVKSFWVQQRTLDINQIAVSATTSLTRASHLTDNGVALPASYIHLNNWRSAGSRLTTANLPTHLDQTSLYSSSSVHLKCMSISATQTYERLEHNIVMRQKSVLRQRTKKEECPLSYCEKHLFPL